MTTIQFANFKNNEIPAPSATIGQNIKLKKPVTVTIACIMMYALAGLLSVCVMTGAKDGAGIIVIALIGYLAYGLSVLKSSAWKGTIVFSSFYLMLNSSVYYATTNHLLLIDILVHLTIIALLLSPSARKTEWKKRSEI